MKAKTSVIFLIFCIFLELEINVGIMGLKGITDEQFTGTELISLLTLTGHQRSQFGRGQIITVGDWWNPSATQACCPPRVLWAGSDPRADGCALGY